MDWIDLDLLQSVNTLILLMALYAHITNDSRHK